MKGQIAWLVEKKDILILSSIVVIYLNNIKSTCPDKMNWPNVELGDK